MFGGFNLNDGGKAGVASHTVCLDNLRVAFHRFSDLEHLLSCSFKPHQRFDPCS